MMESGSAMTSASSLSTRKQGGLGLLLQSETAEADIEFDRKMQKRSW